ncbi:MAG: hypothetical protein IPL61_26355 [Myxococcales bacterium]|nr:hypothetical protein [Myxococcales bacterium]
MRGPGIGALALALVAGCAFDPSARGTSGDDDAPTGPDARAELDAPDPLSIDAPGPCPDDDGDTVCNIGDRCPGQDDRQDRDADGTPDACDAWDCGPTAPSINLPTSTGGDLNATMEAWSFGFDGNVIEVSPGAQLLFGDSVAMRDSNDACTGCNDQIEVGWAAGARFQCFDFGNPTQSQTQRQTRVAQQITMPTTPGRHDVVLQVAQAGNCTGNGGERVNGWYRTVPTAPIVAAVCVR